MIDYKYQHEIIEHCCRNNERWNFNSLLTKSLSCKEEGSTELLSFKISDDFKIKNIKITNVCDVCVYSMNVSETVWEDSEKMWAALFKCFKVLESAIQPQ